MKTLKITNTDLTPSVLCLGGAMYGSAISEEVSFRMMDLFCEKGGTFIDTAHSFADWIPNGKGASELTIGKWLHSRGMVGKAIVTTKGGAPYLENRNISRLSEKEVLSDLETSLERMKVNSIDLFFLHCDNINVPVGEIVEMMNGFKKKGLIRWFGASNWTPERLVAAQRYAQEKRLEEFCASQIGWSLATMKNWEEIDPYRYYMGSESLKFYQKTRIPVLAYSAQASGFFAGKYGIKKLDESIASIKWVKDYYYTAENIEVFERVKRVARETQSSLNSVALAYIFNQKFPAFAIIGARSTEQLIHSCGAADLKLSSKQIDFLSTGKETFFAKVFKKFDDLLP
jgi:aryl-alcohol dehydrogenase-like predicted oxidoreductase